MYMKTTHELNKPTHQKIATLNNNQAHCTTATEYGTGAYSGEFGSWGAWKQDFGVFFSATDKKNPIATINNNL